MSDRVWRDREKYGLLLLGLLAVAAFALGVFIKDPDAGHVTVTVGPCSNPEPLHVAGDVWQSEDLAPAS